MRDSKSSKLEKILTAVGISLLAAYFAVFPSAHLTQKRINKDTKEYVESNLDKIMKEQEEKLGIKHVGTPDIVYDYESNNLLGFGVVAMGLYLPKHDKIFLGLRSRQKEI